LWKAGVRSESRSCCLTCARRLGRGIGPRSINRLPIAHLCGARLRPGADDPLAALRTQIPRLKDRRHAHRQRERIPRFDLGLTYHCWNLPDVWLRVYARSASLSSAAPVAASVQPCGSGLSGNEDLEEWAEVPTHGPLLARAEVSVF